MTFHHASKIIGSFYYFGSIVMVNDPPSLPVQTDGIIESVSISPPPATGIPTYYEDWEPIATAEPVAWDNTYYDNWLSLANQWGAVDPGWNNSSVDLSTYPNRTAIFRKVIIKGSTTITGPGTICATGNPNGGDFQTWGNSNVRFVGPVRIIARGTGNSITFNGATVFTSTPEIIALDSLHISDTTTTPADAILYAKGAGGSNILIDVNAIVGGSILAPYGEVTCKGNGWIRGLVYADSFHTYDRTTLEGGGIYKNAADFLNDSMAIQNPDVLPPTLPFGLSFEASASSFEVYNWRETY